jgi:hypothetical protein
MKRRWLRPVVRTHSIAMPLLAAGLVALLLAPSHAGAKRRSCGTYSSESIYPRARVIAIRGVGCNRALRVAKRFDHKASAPGAWHCFLGHGGRRLFSCGYPAPSGGGPITSARHALRARGVGDADRTAPKFDGLEAATTCIPGPIGPPHSSSYSLRWSAASDDQTPADQIVYDVYQATEAGGESFAAPTYTTAPGAVSFTTPPLSSDKTWYFVVRARDSAGNRDSNRRERDGQNLCL